MLRDERVSRVSQVVFLQVVPSAERHLALAVDLRGHLRHQGGRGQRPADPPAPRTTDPLPGRTGNPRPRLRIRPRRFTTRPLLAIPLRRHPGGHRLRTSNFDVRGAQHADGGTPSPRQVESTLPIFLTVKLHFHGSVLYANRILQQEVITSIVTQCDPFLSSVSAFFGRLPK